MIPEQIKAILPDVEEAERFLKILSEKYPLSKLFKDKSLLADVLTLASYSPFLGTVILQNPTNISWLSKQKRESKTRDKEELLESLARFSMVNFDLPQSDLLNDFKQREFLRIYLDDIRQLKTIAEVTEEISDLADAILESAFRTAYQEISNLYGTPLERDGKGRIKKAEFCIVALGKLGSKELNYASDIDLMFLYSNEGITSETGIKGSLTNREYFVKLSEQITKIINGGLYRNGAYRIDLRLRPYGKVGSIAISIPEAIKYYRSASQSWERQALIRARPCAGSAEVFKSFYEKIVELIFPKELSIQEALRNVRFTKEKINLEQRNAKTFNVKLGKGGIREIEFIAQALQIAYGGKDVWIRSPHTLIALSRLADRELISTDEFRQLSNAYTFLRRLEHRLQMEQGLQIHHIPESPAKKEILARRMNLSSVREFEDELALHTENVSRIFERIFSEERKPLFIPANKPGLIPTNKVSLPEHVVFILGKEPCEEKKLVLLEHFCKTSPYLSQMLSSKEIIRSLPDKNSQFQKKDFKQSLTQAVKVCGSFTDKLSSLRREWSKLLLEIAFFDVFEKINYSEAKILQTELADSSIFVATEIAKETLGNQSEIEILGLGKLGGKGMDYGSDLDLVFVCDPKNQKVCEYVVKVLSSFTREGNLYKVDMRLRPYGKNGNFCISDNAFLEYLQSKSVIWEWLAYVKLRSILDPSKRLETQAKRIIHERARKTSVKNLKEETKRIRLLLEQQKAANNKQFNIKFSAGGKLDVYFAMRFLQLRDSVLDDEEERSTLKTLEKLHDRGSLIDKDFKALHRGYAFLNQLDHLIRLTVGPVNYVPFSNKQVINVILKRMNLEDVEKLKEKLLFHRFEIHEAFERILR